MVNLGSYKDAEEQCFDVIPRVNETIRNDEIFTVKPMVMLARIYIQQGDFNRAVKYLDRVISHAYA